MHSVKLPKQQGPVPKIEHGWLTPAVQTDGGGGLGGGGDGVGGGGDGVGGGGDGESSDGKQ